MVQINLFLKMEAEKIVFDKIKLRKFKKFYQKAVDDKKEAFDFHGRTYLTMYAKYVIEYLEDKFKN